MKTAVVSSQQLHVFNRMDAGFNIWAYEMINGLQTGDRESFWIWFVQSNCKRSELERTLVSADNLDEAVVNFMRYMKVRYLPGGRIDKIIPNWNKVLRTFVHGLVLDLIAKKQAEVDLAMKEMDTLKSKFRINA